MARKRIPLKYLPASVQDGITLAESIAAAPVQSVAGKTGTVALVKGDVGLSNADNTSDANKPVSSATQTALNAKENAGVAVAEVAAHAGLSDPHGVYQKELEKGAANGYAGLDGAGLVPVSQLPGLPAAWGAITGVLSAQTDLQSALDGKSGTGHNHDSAYEPKNSNIQAHVSQAHAPSDAQKNSDITKAEIEARLTGEISSHTHAPGGGADPTQGSFAPGSFTITTGKYALMAHTVEMTTTQQLIGEGTSCLRVI